MLETKIKIHFMKAEVIEGATVSQNQRWTWDIAINTVEMNMKTMWIEEILINI